MTTESTSAWLLEWPKEPNFPTRWWHVINGWMIDAKDATRFSRREDVEAYQKAEHMHGVPTEHKWIDALQAPPLQSARAGEGK